MPSSSLYARTFWLAVLIISAVFILMMRPFYTAIFWAATLAVLLWPLHRKVSDRLRGRPNLAALCTLGLSTLTVIIPLGMLGLTLVREIGALYQRVGGDKATVGRSLQEVAERIPPQVWHWLDRFGVGNLDDLRDALSQVAQQALSLLYTHAAGIGQNTLQFVVAFGVMLYLLFFFFRDGVQLVHGMRRAIPMQADYLDTLSANVASVVKATIRGNVVVAAVQGALGGLMFLALGIPGPVLWGVVMAFLSLLPAVGAALVWAPVAIYLLATGSVVKGVFMIAVGAGVIGMIDNVLRPVLVGRQTSMPDYLILVATLGGLTLFGPSGFVAGPLVAALFLSIWRLSIQRNAAEAQAALPMSEDGVAARDGDAAPAHGDGAARTIT